MQLLRRFLPPDYCSAQGLRKHQHGETVTLAGIVTTRQRPATAKGFLFMLIEDETGMVNVVVRPQLYEERWEVYRGQALLVVHGTLDRREHQINLIAEEAWSMLDDLPDPVKSPKARRLYEALTGFQPPRPHNFR
jgi:DNA polymerase III alpha subunit